MSDEREVIEELLAQLFAVVMLAVLCVAAYGAYLLVAA